MQWQRLTEIPRFRTLARDDRQTNNGRYADREAIYKEIGAITAQAEMRAIEAELAEAKIPNARINTVPQVSELPAVSSRTTSTHMPDGKKIRMQPMAVDLAGAAQEFDFPPKYGEHTDAVLEEAGFDADTRRRMHEDGLIR